jgi:hypothetical protein
MDNLISTCYVIESADVGVEPIIYLKMPHANMFGNEQILTFPNPFTAKAYIQKFCGANIFVTVTKEQYSQLLNVK